MKLYLTDEEIQDYMVSYSDVSNGIGLDGDFKTTAKFDLIVSDKTLADKLKYIFFSQEEIKIYISRNFKKEKFIGKLTRFEASAKTPATFSFVYNDIVKEEKNTKPKAPMILKETTYGVDPTERAPGTIIMSSDKQPIGLKPRGINDYERLNEVRGAIARYYDANLKIDVKWIKEYNKLIQSVSENSEKCTTVPFCP